MAENETDSTLEEISPEEGDSNSAIKALLTPMRIKIAIGLVALIIIAVGAYFFFMPADVPSPEEVSVDIADQSISPDTPMPELVDMETASPDSLSSPSSSNDYTAEDIERLKMREEAVALREENLQMKERLSKLESQQNPIAEPMIPEEGTATSLGEGTTSPEGDKEVSVVVPIPKVKSNPYANLYSRDYTVVREPQREPPPEPKWGNFDPLYRGK